MSIDYQAVLDAIAQHATDSALFGDNPVLTYEARGTQADGLMCAVFLQELAPIPGRSGLASTSALLTAAVRIYGLTQRDPFAGLDPSMFAAAHTLIGLLSGDLDLGDQVSNIDVLGAHSPGMGAKSAYLTHEDGTRVRIVTITVPMVVDDVWGQATA